MGTFVHVILTIISAVTFQLISQCNICNYKVMKMHSFHESDGPYLKYKVYPDPKATDNHLMHVLHIFEQMGYQQASKDDCKWDILWAHEYPFINMSQTMHNLLSHQVVNHFPGIGYITSKVHLSTSSLPFMPKAFHLPTQSGEFLKYAQCNPEKLFMEKHIKHRFINIRSLNSINWNSKDIFIQEFIQNPFLVDGYKFDIGVYVVMTSVDPLITYLYNGDALFRYCRAKYHPFDSTNLDKYVVGSNYLPTWKVPSLIKYYKTYGGSMRDAFDAYVRDQSLDPSGIWEQVEEIIRETILSKIHLITRATNSYRSGIFFELLRFDFFLDDTLKVYLMEVNMSPNLSSLHFKQNAVLYDQILYSVFNLVGVGSSLVKYKRFTDNPEFITSDKNIVTNLNKCNKYDCYKSCSKVECEFCLPCLKKMQIKILRKAYIEQLHKVDMKRIYPKTVIDSKNIDMEVEVRNLSSKNAWLTRWFYERCKEKRHWCE